MSCAEIRSDLDGELEESAAVYEEGPEAYDSIADA